MTQSHIPYEKRFGRPCDFVVSYRSLLRDNTELPVALSQGQRSDFAYVEDLLETEPAPTNYMIWPEFIDEHGNPIGTTGQYVSDSGTARMWILDERLRDFHRQRMKVGTRGFMVRGGLRLAEAEVVCVEGLDT